MTWLKFSRIHTFIFDLTKPYYEFFKIDWDSTRVTNAYTRFIYERNQCFVSLRHRMQFTAIKGIKSNPCRLRYLDDLSRAVASPGPGEKISPLPDEIRSWTFKIVIKKEQNNKN